MTNGEYEQLFQACVDRAGAAYITARDQLLRAGSGVRVFLEGKAAQDDWRVRITAEILLGWLAHREMYEGVLDEAAAIRVTHARVQPIAGQLSLPRRAEIVAGLGTDVVPRLIEILLKSRDYRNATELQVVTLALDYLKDPRAVMPLAELARGSDDEGVQTLALAVLGSLGDRRAVDVARAALGDDGKGPVVRGVAAITLGQLSDTSATPALLAIATNQIADRALREHVVTALGYMRDPDTVSALASLLRRRPDEHLSLALVGALSRIGGQPAIAVLDETARGHPSTGVRRAAQEARESLVA